MVEQIDSSLPVFHVESTGDPAKSRVLHRNMLFPLLTCNLNQAQSSQDDVSRINSLDGESVSLDLVEEPYTGPMACSRTKGITKQTVDIVTKANNLMEQHFGIIQEVQWSDFNPDYPDLFAHIEAGFRSIQHWLMNR